MNKNPTYPTYYTPGNPKRDRKITRDWLLRVARKAVTNDDVISAIHELRRDDPKGFLQWYNSICPQESLVKTDSSITVRVISDGVRPKEIEGEIVQDIAELPSGNDE